MISSSSDRSASRVLARTTKKASNRPRRPTPDRRSKAARARNQRQLDRLRNSIGLHSVTDEERIAYIESTIADYYDLRETAKRRKKTKNTPDYDGTIKSWERLLKRFKSLLASHNKGESSRGRMILPGMLGKLMKPAV